MRKKIRKYLKKGSGEALGFTVMAPFMVMLIALLINFVQYVGLKEKIEYTTYVAGRAAVVSETKKMADKNAELAAKQNMLAYQAYIKPGSFKVKLSYPSGTKARKVTDAAGQSKTSSWAKGNYITCTVTAKTNLPILFFSGKTVKVAMTMAIEKLDF